MQRYQLRNQIYNFVPAIDEIRSELGSFASFVKNVKWLFQTSTISINRLKTETANKFSKIT